MRVSGILSAQVELLLGLGASEVRLLNTDSNDDKIGVAAAFTTRFTVSKSDYEALKEMVGLHSVFAFVNTEYTGNAVDMIYTYSLEKQEEHHEEK